MTCREALRAGPATAMMLALLNSSFVSPRRPPRNGRGTSARGAARVTKTPRGTLLLLLAATSSEQNSFRDKDNLLPIHLLL